MSSTVEKKKLNPGNEMTCILKILDTSSKGWKTISKVLKTIEGVSYSIDAVNGQLSVYGMIDPAALMFRLRKSCKHVELVRVDAGTYRESRVKKLLKERELAEDRAYYERYGCYPQQAPLLYNKIGVGSYPYPAPPYHHDPYYGRSSAFPPPPHPYHQQYGHYPNGDYYRQPPMMFPPPPPPPRSDVHRYYDPDVQCRIM